MQIKVKGSMATPKIQTAATIAQAVRMVAEAGTGKEPVKKIGLTGQKVLVFR